MNIKTTLKLSVTAAALFAIATPVASPANAADDTIKSGNKNLLTISGQLVRAMWYADDGEHEQLFNSEGNSTNSRVRWVFSGKINENVSGGGLIEMDIPDSQASGNQTFDPATGGGSTGGDDGNWSIRHEYVWISHKQFGKVSLGQTDAAANGNTEGSLAGVSGLSTPTSWVWQGSGIQFLDTSTASNGSATGVTVGSVRPTLDFTSRTDVIRYDTPKFMGLGLAASLNGDGGGEIGGRYSGKFGPVNVIVLGGYTETSSTGGQDHLIGGSMAVLHESGLNASVHGASAEQDASTRKARSSVGFSVGYRAKIFKVGGTNFRGVYGKSRHTNANGDEAESWGIDAAQHIDAIGAQIALAYRNYDYENNRIGHTSIDTIDVFGVQALFKF